MFNYEEMFAQSIELPEPWYVEKAEYDEDTLKPVERSEWCKH